MRKRNGVDTIDQRTRRKDRKKGEREREIRCLFSSIACACSRNRWIQGRRVTDNRLQRVYFFQGRARYKMDETKASMEARSRPIDSAISFAFLVFRFSPAAAAFARGGTQLRWVSLHGPNSISCGLLIFFSPFFLFLFLSSYGIARERRRRREKKVGREGIFYGECVHGCRESVQIESRTSCRDSSTRFSRNNFVHLRLFAKHFNPRLRFDAYTG